jgi:hypothetical protein
MASHFSIPCRSGYVVVTDAGASPHPDGSDLEALQRAGEQRQLLYWPAIDDEVEVRVLPGTTMPPAMARVATEVASGLLDAPTGTLRFVDAADLVAAEPASAQPPPAVQVEPGAYRASAWLLDWPTDAYDAALRRSAGRVATAARDGLGLFTFLLAAATLIGLPVFLVGRALEGGIAATAAAIPAAAVLLIPLWVVVVVGWRLPAMRRVAAADASTARRFPDAVLLLDRISDPSGAPPAEPAHRPRRASAS